MQENYIVGIYARLSRDDERAGESVSIENQKEMLSRYVREQGWTLYDYYCDDGVSGTTFDRPGLNRLVQDATDHKINLVLCKDLSRLGRDYIEAGKYTDFVFPSLGCRFIALNDGVDTLRKIALQHNAEKVPAPRSFYYMAEGRENLRSETPFWNDVTVKTILRNEVYIGHMVQNKTGTVSYKNHKQVSKPESEWIKVENTHEPLIDKETFQKVRMLVNSRRHTRSRTYDFLLKGLIFCHECGYPMAVLNRPPVSGEDRLFFVCRTYQRFTKAGVCSCHSIKEQVVTEAVLAKVREVCEAYLDPNKLQPIAADAVEKARKAENHEAEIQSIQNKIDSLTANLDKMYMDRLTGLLAEADFERIYQRVKMDRTSLEEKLKELESQKESLVSTEDRARELVQQFLDSAYTSRELLVSLIERVELTENKQIIIKFRFRELEAIS